MNKFRSMRIYFYHSIALTICILCPAVLHSEDVEESEHREGQAFHVYEESYEDAKKIKPIRFKGFGLYRSRFQKFCRLLEEDGHIEWLSLRVKELSKSREICAQCRSLYVTLNSACSTKRKKSSPKSTPTPEIIEEVGEESDLSEEADESEQNENDIVATSTAIPQITALGTQTVAALITFEDSKLEPQTELIDLSSRIFRQMADDKEAAEDNYKAVEHFIGELLSKQNRSKAEMAYFEILTAYIQAPFKARNIGVALGNKQSRQGQSSPPVESTDWLNDKL